MALSRSEKGTSNFPFALLASIYVCFLALFVAILFISERQDVPLQNFTGDPAHILHGHPFVGFISNIGVLLWCATACICIFSFFVINKSQDTAKGAFLLFSGLLSLLLLLDDLFMLHEFIVPHYTVANQEFVYGLYVIIIIAWVYYFWDELLNSEYEILGIAILFMGGSVLGDLVFPISAITYLLEDALKLFGIATWFIYFARQAFYRIFSTLEPSKKMDFTSG